RMCGVTAAKRRSAAACTAALLAAFACSTTPVEPSEWPPPREPTVVLQPGDALKFTFAYWSELNDEQTIRPDGIISLQHVGEVRAQGLTPGQLKDELTSLY